MLNIWNDALNLLCFLDTDHKCVFSKLNYGHVQLAHLHSFGIISVVLAFEGLIKLCWYINMVVPRGVPFCIFREGWDLFDTDKLLKVN